MHPFTTSTLIQTLPFPKDYIREDIMTVLNQVRPSSLRYQKSFAARAICLGLGAADIVAGRALRRIRPFQTGWKGEAGPSPTPRARSMGSSRAPWQSMGSSRAPWQLVARVGQRYILTLTLPSLRGYFKFRHQGDSTKVIK